ncbi:uncharacterized protein DSM5745_10227 [Aspergillus mulundensis]|uniref:SUN domain-containing protein n=1 Tax=Aspergillus mulundensis TaxID=1810919 RepID=A0A3D8QMQ3_9EURO|nr:Uncharacterized protein DSM5745_10227 [Aspergillus mulundensis]RDW63116.1 Uncharacterized protein DSM5745_10227 [Aspergillus mulundensis]
MPPKATARRARAVKSASPVPASRKAGGPSPNLGPSSNFGGGMLPNIPAKASFAYGSSESPILPYMLDAKPAMTLDEVAEQLKESVDVAKEREKTPPYESPAMGTRARRSAENSPRRNLRLPTPDEIQLLNSLEEASSASATPSTPTRHSFSSGSSVIGFTQKQLYPAAMEATPIQAKIPVDDKLYGLGLDNMSVISYNLERGVHDDDLKRARSNITAPPRRISGLDLKHSAIEEEDEDFARTPSDYGRTASEASYAAATKTPIRRHIPISDSSTVQWEKATNGWIPFLLRCAVAAMVLFGVYSMWTSGSSDVKPIRSNNSDLNALSSQVVHLGAQVSSLSKDMKSVQADISKAPAATTVWQYPGKKSPEIIKTNFLTMGNGIIVDPWLTSPSAARKLTYLQTFYFWLAGNKHMKTQPPLTATAPWNDFGDCWCSAPKKGVTQLGVLLGQRIIPEDIVVEHLPKLATIRPQVAPQDVEVWARYRYVGKGRPYLETWLAFFLGYPKNIAGQDFLPSDRALVRPPVMEALRSAWRGESETKFSNDRQLGPDFYRIAKFTYDINGAHHIQKFAVNAYIDSPDLRVDKVVFRVNSNWGGNETCIYRLKLLGRL